jgi:hypothetical protein
MANDADRLKGAMGTIVNATIPALDAYAFYPSTVKSQTASGGLDVVTDDTRIGGMQNVPIAYGIPGVKVKVSAGARVLLGFAGGDFRQPRATLWDSASVTEIDITATLVKVNGGSLGAARHTDQITITPAQVLAAGLTSPSGAVTAASNLVGTITGGSSSVEIGS